jgi:hypothetical protein
VDITLVELAEMLRREHGAHFALSTVPRFLDRHTMTVKKIAHASEQGRPDVAAKRRAWFDVWPDLHPERLVFIDETGASAEMARLRGRARGSQRCRAPVPHGHWQATTFTGALRLPSLAGPVVLGGPMNRAAFGAYIEQMPVPTLRPATSSSWTACPPKRARARAPPSRPQAPSVGQRTEIRRGTPDLLQGAVPACYQARRREVQ